MNNRTIYRYLPFIVIGVIILVFIVNVLTHGRIDHPGKTVYKNECAHCHGENAEGIRALVPPIAGSDFAIQHFDSLPCWIRNGMNHPISVNGKEYDQPMYPSDIDEIQIANVINYLNDEYLKGDKEINSAWVKEKLKTCQ